MKNKFFILMVSVAISAMSPVFAMEEGQDQGHASANLRWQDRPREIIEKI